jgi:hypothetical protein
LSIEDEECSGRSTQVTIPLEAIHSMILDNKKISTKRIAETLAIACERIGYIIYKTVDMRKLSAKWVPKYLNAGQKHDGARFTSQFGLILAESCGIFNHLVTMDKILIHIYDPETKEQPK